MHMDFKEFCTNLYNQKQDYVGSKEQLIPSLWLLCLFIYCSGTDVDHIHFKINTQSSELPWFWHCLMTRSFILQYCATGGVQSFCQDIVKLV